MEEDGLADVCRKIVGQIRTTTNWDVHNGEGVASRSEMENHVMMAEQKRLVNEKGPSERYQMDAHKFGFHNRVQFDTPISRRAREGKHWTDHAAKKT